MAVTGDGNFPFRSAWYRGRGRGRGRGAQPRVVTSLEFNEASKLAWTDYFFEPASGPVTHAATGALTGQIGNITATANRFRQFSSTGTLIGANGAIVGAASRSAGPVTHSSSGALTGPGSTIAGASTRFRSHGTTGALTGPGAVIAATSSRFRSHGASGALVGQGAVIAGSAARTPAPVAHAASGALQGSGAIITGSADRGALPAASGSEFDLLRRRRRRVH